VAGILSALILAFALAHPTSTLVLLAYATSVPIFCVGFAFGLPSGGVAALAGTLGLLAAAPLGVALEYSVTFAVPALIFLALSLRERPMTAGVRHWAFSEGTLLSIVLLYPSLIFIAVILAIPGHAAGLLAHTVHIFDGAMDQVTTALQKSGQTLTPEVTLKVQHSLDYAAHLVPAVAMGTWLLITVLSVVVAQSMLPFFKVGERPPFTLERLRLPSWIFVALFLLIAGSFAPRSYGYVALNLAVLFAIPYCFTGLAVVHAWAAKTKYALVVLIIFYLLIAYLLPLVAILGAVDQWADFRKKAAPSPST
jgi:uncharacterized protein YybS (DUF2232 family)